MYTKPYTQLYTNMCTGLHTCKHFCKQYVYKIVNKCTVIVNTFTYFVYKKIDYQSKESITALCVFLPTFVKAKFVPFT